jgi:hypothetical protein
VASLVILADDSPTWRPTHYSYEPCPGCKTGIEFRSAKLTDYQPRLDELLAAENVFALITAAHGLTRTTRKDDEARYQAKRHLVKILYGKGFDRQKILDLFAMIDWMMWLPQNLSQKLWHDIQTIEEQESMRYVTSIERLEREKVYQHGLNKGESRLLTRLLEKRFGPLPVTVAEKLEAASVQELDTWGDAVLTATRLEDVFG